MQAVLIAKRGFTVSGIPSVDCGNWGWEGNSLCYPVLTLREQEQHDLQHAVFCEESLGKNHALYVHLKNKDVARFRNRSVQEL